MSLDAYVVNANMANQKRKSSPKPNLQQTVPKEQLVKDGVYRLYKNGVKQRDLAVFMHLGSTGMPIFHPLGEPDFQSCFGLMGYGINWIVIFEHDGTPEDLGY